MRVTEHSFSDLLRHPNEVTADLESGDVLLRRRDEPDIRLSLAADTERRLEVFRLMAGSFRHLALHAPSALDAAILDTFAWSEFLPVKDRLQFAGEFSRTLMASAEIDIYESLGQLVQEWRETADIYASPSLSRRLKKAVPSPLGKRVSVP
jgi:hypothetical protein